MSNKSEYNNYVKKLNKLSVEALPRVIASALNAVAKPAHEKSIALAKTKMTMRNAYTVNSIRMYNATPKSKIEKINAISGSISPYMDEQDSGGYRLPKIGKHAPVATLLARGGSKSGIVRKRFKAGQVGKNQFVGVPKGKLGLPKGVWLRTNKNTKIELIRNLSENKIAIKANHWHNEAMKSTNAQKMHDNFVKEAEKELKTLGAK